MVCIHLLLHALRLFVMASFATDYAQVEQLEWEFGNGVLFLQDIQILVLLLAG